RVEEFGRTAQANELIVRKTTARLESEEASVLGAILLCDALLQRPQRDRRRDAQMKRWHRSAHVFGWAAGALEVVRVEAELARDPRMQLEVAGAQTDALANAALTEPGLRRRGRLPARLAGPGEDRGHREQG